MTLSISIGSMLPPESMTAVVPGFSILPSISAATPTAPAGSTTILDRSSRKISARARASSLTVTTSSTSSRMMLKGSCPGRPTAMPSAMVETRLQRHQGVRGERGRVGGGVFGLHADDLDLPAQFLGPGLHGDGDAGQQAAAADAHQDGVHVAGSARGSPGPRCPGRPRRRRRRRGGRRRRPIRPRSAWPRPVPRRRCGRAAPPRRRGRGSRPAWAGRRPAACRCGP